MTKDDARKALTEVPTSMTARMLGVDRSTLYVWRDRGKIKFTRTKSGRMLWNCADYLEREAKSAS
jgi:predicted site-specific integrase-resolvase